MTNYQSFCYFHQETDGQRSNCPRWLTTQTLCRFMKPGGSVSWGRRVPAHPGRLLRKEGWALEKAPETIKHPVQPTGLSAGSEEGGLIEKGDTAPNQHFFLGYENFLKSGFGKLITISFQRPIRSKPVGCRHIFEFQSLRLTQLINGFLKADWARRPSFGKPLGRGH